MTHALMYTEQQCTVTAHVLTSMYCRLGKCKQNCSLYIRQPDVERARV